MTESELKNRRLAMIKKWCHLFDTENDARTKCPFEMWCDEAMAKEESDVIATCNHTKFLGAFTNVK